MNREPELSRLQELFQPELPRLQELSERHEDPDDEFTFEALYESMTGESSE